MSANIHEWFPSFVGEYGAFAGIQTFGEIQIRFAVVFPGVLVRNSHMAAFDIGVAQSNIMLE